MDTTKVQFLIPLGWVGVTYSHMGEDLLTGAEMVQRQLYQQNPSKEGNPQKP